MSNKQLLLHEQQSLYDQLEKAATFLAVVDLQSNSAGTHIRRDDAVSSIRDAISLIGEPLRLMYQVG